MKTATIERHAYYGTPRHYQCVTYRGHVLRWAEPGNVSAMAHAPCNGHETIGAMIEHARRFGFTHVRFAGDWTRYTVRKRMQIPAGRYVFVPPTIDAILQGVTQ